MNEIETSQSTTEMIRQTYAPIGSALGITMIFWGFLCHPFGISIWFMSIAGGAMLAWALYVWMKEICREWSIQDES